MLKPIENLLPDLSASQEVLKGRVSEVTGGLESLDTDTLITAAVTSSLGKVKVDDLLTPASWAKIGSSVAASLKEKSDVLYGKIEELCAPLAEKLKDATIEEAVEVIQSEADDGLLAEFHEVLEGLNDLR